MDGQRDRSRSAVRGRAVSCQRLVRVFRNPWVHGRMADGDVAVSGLETYMCWSAARCSAGRGSVCKTVGSAYVGSNPTPATTCENGPLAGNSRLCGPFLLCPVMCHLVALYVTVSRCPRTYSGRRRAARTVGIHRRLSTDGHGRAAPVACSGLTCAAESSVHSPVSARRPVASSRGGAGGEGRVR